MYTMVEADTLPNPKGDKMKPRAKMPSGLYRSEDGGATWTRTNESNTRPFYYSQVRVHPRNPNRVYWSSTPVLVSNDGGKTPMVHYQDLADLGYKLINYSGMLQRSAIRGMMDVAQILMKEGSTASAYPSRICDLAERSDLLGLEEFYELEERLYGPLMESEGSWRCELVAKGKGRASKRLPI
jgi:hypothetical protein